MDYCGRKLNYVKNQSVLIIGKKVLHCEQSNILEINVERTFNSNHSLLVGFNYSGVGGNLNRNSFNRISKP